MSYPRCKTCRHYDVSLAGILPGYGNFGRCENPNLLSLDDGTRAETPPDMFGVDFNDAGHLAVGPEFGCIHHEQKESTPPEDGAVSHTRPSGEGQ